VVKNLCDNGYFIFNEKIDQIHVDKLIYEYKRLLQDASVVQSGQSTGRIYKPHLKSDEVMKYVDKFNEHAIEYFGSKNIKVESSILQKTIIQTSIENVPGASYHMDDNRKHLKFFIYLTDVNELNGPFTLSPKTHGPKNLGGICRWIGWEITRNRKYLYYNKLPLSSSQPIQVLGGKGTIFCADTTILHKAEVLKKGERLVLVISFNEKRYEPLDVLSSFKKKLRKQ
jgi:uncharacterized protein YbcV (DUF1398 family)